MALRMPLPAQAVSIRAPLAGSDVERQSTFPASKTFQSALPSRGATVTVTLSANERAVSIRAPLAGSDRRIAEPALVGVVSIRAPLAGSDSVVSEYMG